VETDYSVLRARGLDSVDYRCPTIKFGAGVRSAQAGIGSLRKQVRHGWKIARLLLQLCVLRFGFFQDGDFGIGVFPERKEILVGSLGFGGVAGEDIRTGELEAGE